MSKRNHLEDSIHCLMINVLVDSYEKQGYEVLADHVGGLKKASRAIGGYVPDIVAKRGDEVNIIEVETESTLGDPVVELQMRNFAAAAPTRLYLAVPFECVEVARNLRKALNIEFDILPCYPFVRYVGIPR